MSNDPADMSVPAIFAAARMIEENHRMTLTDFLLARIEEDRAVAGGASVYNLHRGGYTKMVSGRLMVDPERVLAECEAKWRIVVALGPCVALREPSPAIARGYESLLTYLALPYAFHPDYREEWA